MHRTIISVTSFPPRVQYIAPALQSILEQCENDDFMVLWLGQEQFPNRMDDVPSDVLSLFARYHGRCEIRFTPDIRSFKKLLPALEAFPESTIITLDDDNYYPRGVISMLKDAALRCPGVVLSHCVSDLYRIRRSWRRTTGNSGLRFGGKWLRMPIGGGGVLYPPHSLDDLVFDMDLARKICPTSDDIWFWFCAVRAHTPVRKIRDGIIRHRGVPNAALTGALSAINEVNNDAVNLKHLMNLLSYDPSVEAILLEDYRRNRIWILCSRLMRLIFYYPRQAWVSFRFGGWRMLAHELRRKVKIPFLRFD